MTKLLRAQKKISYLQKIHSKIISIRWLIFFSGVFCVLLFWGNYQHLFFYVGAGILFSLLMVTSFLLASITKKLTKWKHYQHLLEVQENRKDLKWSKLPAYRPPGINAEEFDLLTATDLHLIGPHSVLHLMDSCITDVGQQTLVSYLLPDRESVERIQLRQRKVKELLALTIFRMKFKLLGILHSKELIKRENIFSLFGAEVFQKNFYGIFTVLVLVQLLNLGLILATVFWGAKPYYVLSTPCIFLLYQLLKNHSHSAFEFGLKLQISLERLLTIFSAMEKLPVKKEDALYEEFSEFQTTPPSQLLRKVNIVVALLSARTNPLLGLILNLLLPWDFGLLIILESLKFKHYPHLKVWMGSLSRLEALVSLADYSENAGGIFPTFLDSKSETYVEAVQLSHPLMDKDKRVANSYGIHKDSPISLITGSNMAGKSTFLRTVGLNLALAKAGTTVLAHEFKLQNLSVMSLIKAQDFLEKEMSLFYFEVKRLKEILGQGRLGTAEHPFLFLVDEIYRGTNNLERHQGAVAYLKEFSRTPNCCGLLTTHDINVAHDLSQDSSIKQYHFKEIFKDGALLYDYTINPGACETTNALRIMENEGLPV